MNLHRNARTTPISRAEMARRVLAGQAPTAVATAMGVEMLTEEEYFALQKLGEFDTKSSS